MKIDQRKIRWSVKRTSSEVIFDEFVKRFIKDEDSKNVWKKFMADTYYNTAKEQRTHESNRFLQHVATEATEKFLNQLVQEAR